MLLGVPPVFTLPGGEQLVGELAVLAAAAAAARLADENRDRSQLRHLCPPLPFVGGAQLGLVNLVRVTVRVTITTGSFSATLSDSRGRVVIQRAGFALLPPPPATGSIYQFGDAILVSCGVTLDSTWVLSGCDLVSDDRVLLARSG